jgi:hypothetical protein
MEVRGQAAAFARTNAWLPVRNVRNAATGAGAHSSSRLASSSGTIVRQALFVYDGPYLHGRLRQLFAQLTRFGVPAHVIAVHLQNAASREVCRGQMQQAAAFTVTQCIPRSEAVVARP